MRGFLAVFERELAERRLLAVAALAFGLIAVAVPLVPGLHKGGLTPSDVRGGVALGFALILSTLTAVFLGGSVLVSDLLERRMGFYFARPLSGWALWLGKTAAALVLIFGAGLLVLLPALLLGSNFDAGGLGGFNGVGQLMSGVETFTVWAFGLLLIFFATNALLLMVRSRSPWVALDVAALVLVVAMIWLARNRLLMAGVGIGSKNWWAGSLDVFTWLGNVLVLATLGAFVAAGAGQVVQGRTDVRRAHRAVSSILWGTLIVVGIAFQALTLWWVRVSPSDLMGVTQIAAVPEGSSWIAFAGPAAHRPGYSPAFFYDVASGRSIPANMGPFSPWWGMPVRISADGRWAVWPVFQGISSQSPAVFHRLDLKSPGAEPQPTRISFLGLPEGFALSPDGRRIAILARHRLTVEDLDTSRLLASAAYSGQLWFSRLTFVGPDRVRLYRFLTGDWTPASRGQTGFDILELNLAAGKLEKTGSVSDVRELTSWNQSRNGERVLLRNRSQLQLLEARTGEVLADLGTNGEGASASFLDDGRIALSSGGELRILAQDGLQELHRFHFQGVRTVVPVNQPAPGRLRVVTSSSVADGAPWDLRLLDLRTGTSRSLGSRKLMPLHPPEDAGSRLSLEEGQGVIWREPWSLRWRVVLKD